MFIGHLYFIFYKLLIHHSLYIFLTDAMQYYLYRIHQLTLTEQVRSNEVKNSWLKFFKENSWKKGSISPSMLKICSPNVPAFSSRSASSETLKKYLSVGMLAIALISFIKFLVSRAFLFKYPRTLKTKKEGKRPLLLCFGIPISTF